MSVLQGRMALRWLDISKAYKLDKWTNQESGIRSVFTTPKPILRY